MNALLLVVFALEAGNVTDVIQERTYNYKSDDGASDSFKYRLLAPDRIEPEKKYPVVLFLHGAGERGDDNKAQLKYLPTWMAEPKMRAAYPCFLIAPQVPNNQKWVNAPWDKKTGQPLPEKMSDSINIAVGILDEILKTEPADPDRVYLTGLSMGGYGTWDLAERMPNASRLPFRSVAVAMIRRPTASSACRSGRGMAIRILQCPSNDRGR